MNELWPQQENFCSRVKDFAEREGLVNRRGTVDIPGTAARFDLSPPTLKQFLQNKRRPRPHVNTLISIAGIVGCDFMEWMDSVNSPIPGVTDDRWARASEQDRTLASAILADLMAIPEAEKDAYYQLWKQGMAIGQARMAAESGKVKKPK